MSSVEHGAPGNVLLEVLSRGMYDQDAWERTAAILSEITNHGSKENTPQLDRASSGSLQRRGSSSIVSSMPDASDIHDKQTGQMLRPAFSQTDPSHSHVPPMHRQQCSQPASYPQAPFLGAQQPASRPETMPSWNLLQGRKPKPDIHAKAAHLDRANSSPSPADKNADIIIEPTCDGDWPAHIEVQCNGNVGKFLLGKQSMVCICKLCQAKAVKADLPYTEMTPTEFERHSGMAASKKWKYTVRVQHDGRPIGTWLEMHGYAPKAALREKPAPADFKMSTRERSKTRNRSKSSDASGEQTQGTTGQDRAPAAVLQRAMSLSRSAHFTSSAAASAPALQQGHSTAAADLLVAAAEAVNRTAAGQTMVDDAQRMSRASSRLDAWGPETYDDMELGDKAEASFQHGPNESEVAEAGQGTIRRARRKAVLRPQLRESVEHQAIIPDRLGPLPAPLEDPPRWDPGPSYEDALASASGPEKAAAEMLPLDATFDPDTHEGAALSIQSGFARNQRSLPNKRARRKPGWLDNTVRTRRHSNSGAELDGASDPDGSDSFGGQGTGSSQDLRWPTTRRLRAVPARKRDRNDGDETDMAEEADWRGAGRNGKRARGMRDLDPPFSGFSAMAHAGSNLPHRLRSMPRTSANASTARAELDAVNILGSMQPQVLTAHLLSDEYLQVSVQYKGHTYSGEITLVPEEQQAGQEAGHRTRAPQMGSSCMQHAAGNSMVSLRSGRNYQSPRRHRSSSYRGDYEDMDSGDVSPPPSSKGRDRGPHGPSRFSQQAQPLRPFQQGTCQYDPQSPDQPDSQSGAQVTPPARRRSPNNDGEVQSSSHRQASSAEPMSAEAIASVERRAAVDREFARLEQEGPPEGTRCALCHGTDAEEEQGSQEQDVGQFVLVRVSAIQHAWVHTQCAWWSPEVYESEGVMEGVPEAVRRGRMLRCKVCGDKGATLGCHVRNCRSSYHLPCARSAACLLQEDAHLVTCPRHRAPEPDHAHDIKSHGGHPPYDKAPHLRKDSNQDLMSSSHPHNQRCQEESGNLLLRMSSGMQQEACVGGRPLQEHEQVDDGEEGEDLMRSSSMMDWIRSFDDNSFDPDSVPDAAMADYLGGTVSVAANRPGRCAVCVVQRKGKCGSLSAPSKCRRKLVLAARSRMQQEDQEPWLPQPTHRRRRT